MAADLDVEVVGREFVRQYYTVLNQRPDCLHQFFTQDSSFVHGGVERAGEEQPACQGQAVIHQKILSLNFRDCHTKIRQVDCQKTVGNAVLVQVSGELSNNGELMRRFMQSFVLVQQAPKKFYVHNDIFRYQDEVFHDYHYSQSAASASQEAMPTENDAKVYENHEVRNVSEEKEIATVVVDHHQPAPVVESVANGSYSPVKEQQQQQVSPVATHEISPVPMAVNHIEPISHNDLPSEVQESAQPELVAEVKVITEKVELLKAEEAPVVVENGEKEVYEEKPVTTVVQQQKTFSWATMASKNTSSSATSATPQQNKPQATIKPERKSEALPPSQVAPAAATSPVNSVAPAGIPPKQQVTQTRPVAMNERKWSPPEGEEGGFRSSMANVVPDNQQLFIGNLPHSITEQEVRELFEKFGTVIDIKINRKGASRDLPNFGFVAFDNHDAVTRAMKARPIMLHGKRRINIEEKKDQSGIGSGPRRIPARGGRGGVRGGARMTGRINGGGTNNQMANETEE